jgi:hypothetical protein
VSNKISGMVFSIPAEILKENQASLIWGSHTHDYVVVLAYYTTLKMEAIFSSETLGDFHRTTKRSSQKTELFVMMKIMM